jgi:hypothetical protein
MDLPVKYDTLTQREKRIVRLQYIEEQKGLCFYCKAPLVNRPPSFILSKGINWKLFPKGFLKNPIHLHHSHHTGFTIGATHAYCNAVLFCYKGE